MGGLVGPVLRLIGSVVMVLAVGVFLAFVIASLFLGWNIDPVLGHGMSPAFKTGDAVVIESVEPESIAVGDIMVYHSPLDGEMTAHRVMEVEETEEGLFFRTKADNNEDEDPYVVVAENITGRAKFHIPLLGHMTYFVKSPLGLGLLLGLPGLMLTTMEINRLWGTLIPLEMRRRKARWSTGLGKKDWIR